MSNVKDLRYFIALLEEEYPQHIIRVENEVSPDFEASAILAKMDESGLFSAVVFENVSGAKHIAVDNMHANIRRYVLAMGLPENAGIKEMDLKGRHVDMMKIFGMPNYFLTACCFPKRTLVGNGQIFLLPKA